MPSLTVTPLIIDVLTVLGVLIYAFIRGLRGFGLVMSELIAYCLSLVATLLLYNPLAKPLMGLGVARPLVMPFAFFILWLILDAILEKTIYFRLRDYAERWRREDWNFWLGYLAAILDGTVLAAVIMTVVSVAPILPSQRQALLESHVAGLMIQTVEVADQTLSSAFSKGSSLAFFTETEEQGNAITPLTFSTDDFLPAPEAEDEMLRLINQERTSRGLAPLHADHALAQAAREHASDMLKRGYFSHSTPEGVSPAERASAAGAVYFLMAENLALSKDVWTAHRGLMNSPGHRANILSPSFSRVGIGAEETARYGTMFAQEFAN